MATVPVTRTWVAGEVVTAAHFNNNIRDVLNYLLAPPIFRARQTVAQSVANSTDTVITFTTEDVDSAGGHSNSSNTSRYTYVYPGWMRHSGGICYVSNATGIRLLDWAKNGTGVEGTRTILPAISGFVHSMAARTEHIFGNVGDYVELRSLQSSGGALNTSVVAGSVEQSSFNSKFDSN